MSPPSARRWSLPATRDDVAALFGRDLALVGMVHLLPLPGSPGWGGSMEAVLERALADADALVEGGMDGVLVENYGDLPFHPERVEPETVAALGIVLARVRESVGGRPVGVNVLRNDARGGVGVAAAAGAAFLRVNVHAGTMFSDQGILHGRAHETLRARAVVAPDLLIVGDVLVKHAIAPAGVDPAVAARELRGRGLADVLVVSGARTGAPVDPARLHAVREAVPAAPVWVGSGLDTSNAAELLRRADGAIVGSALQRGGRAGGGVEIERVRRFVAAARG